MSVQTTVKRKTAPDILKKAGADAIFADVNQYAITWGAPKFREAIAEKTRKYLGISIDPEREITADAAFGVDADHRLGLGFVPKVLQGLRLLRAAEGRYRMRSSS